MYRIEGGAMKIFQCDSYYRDK
ncbi:MAG: hypothetical protein LUG93_04295 [Lachnospiraceae bacterium]|nr:hypothetical protein [Lachnospiraceae bacterium]